MPVVSALGRLRQESHEFRSSLGHTVIKASLNYISISERQRRGAREEMGVDYLFITSFTQISRGLCRARKKLCGFE